MSDWRDQASAPADWRAEAEGGGEGGNEGPSKPLIRPTPVVPKSPDQLEHEKQQLGASLSHGQSLDEMMKRNPEAVKKYLDRGNTGAAAEVLSIARGTPLIGAHLDEMTGAVRSGHLSGPEYEAEKSKAQQTLDAAQAHMPSGPAVGSLAFAPFQPSTAVGRVALGTAEGASEGLGNAPDMAHALRPTLAGAGTGLITSAVGEGIRSVGGVVGDKKADVLAKNQADIDRKLEKAFASARGRYGGEVSSGSNLLQSAERASVDPKLPEQLQNAAREWLESPEALALREQVARSNLGRGEDALGRISSSQEAMHGAAANLTPEARAAFAQARLDDPSALLRRVRELGPKVVLPAVGGAIAGPGGAAAGGLLGAIAGRSATTVRNAIADPYVASRLLGAGEAGLKGLGAATQATAPMTARAVTDPLSKWSRFLKPDEEQ